MKTKQFSKGWKEVELGEIGELIMGQSPPGDSYNTQNQGVFLLNGAADFNGNVINPKQFTTKPTKLSRKGDLIFCIRATIGKTTISNKEYCLGRGVAAFRANEKLLNKGFLLKILDKKLKELILQGSTILGVKGADIQKIKISLPSLPIQKQIVLILEKAEKLKQKREEADRKTKEYLQSVFYEMFGDPVRNNKKFEIKRLNEICDVRDGTHASPKYFDEGYPLITSKNLTEGNINFSEVNFISKKDFDEVNKRSKVDVGDIIMPMIGTIGNPIIIPRNLQEFAIKNVALIKFTKTNVSNVYIKFLLDSDYFDHITSGNNRGGTQKFIALGDIRNIPIPLPPLPLQQKFASIVEQVEKLKEKQKKSKEEINVLFDSLMQKAFKGELK